MAFAMKSVGSNATGCFEITDTFSSRADLAKRIETKFSVPGADVAKLRSVLTGSCRPVAHNESVSLVRSVYFDDPRLSACRANLDGLGRRQKLRLRWYDSLRPGTDFFFEIKWRDNRVTGKHRLQMRSERPLAELTYRQILTELEWVLPSRYVPALLTFNDPVVLVEYRREHLHARHSPIRLTIDYDIAFYRQLGKRGLSTAFRQPLCDAVVVEAKTPLTARRELRRLLHPFSARATRSSKYVNGCRTLGLIVNE